MHIQLLVSLNYLIHGILSPRKSGIWHNIHSENYTVITVQLVKQLANELTEKEAVVGSGSLINTDAEIEDTGAVNSPVNMAAGTAYNCNNESCL